MEFIISWFHIWLDISMLLFVHILSWWRFIFCKCPSFSPLLLGVHPYSNLTDIRMDDPPVCTSWTEDKWIQTRITCNSLESRPKWGFGCVCVSLCVLSPDVYVGGGPVCFVCFSRLHTSCSVCVSYAFCVSSFVRWRVSVLVLCQPAHKNKDAPCQSSHLPQVRLLVIWIIFLVIILLLRITIFPLPIFPF